MDIRSVVNLEVEKNGNKFVFSMPVGSQFGDAYGAAFDVLTKVIELSKEAADKMAPKEAEAVQPELVQ